MTTEVDVVEQEGSPRDGVFFIRRGSKGKWLRSRLSMTTADDVVEHEGSPRDGVFFIRRGGRRVAELTYRMLGEAALVVMDGTPAYADVRKA